MSLITIALRVFDDLDTNVTNPDALTEYQVNLLPRTWLHALTQHYKLAEQIEWLYKDEEIPRSFAENLANHVNNMQVVFNREGTRCLGLAYVFEIPSEPTQISFWYAPAPPDPGDFREAEERLGGRLPGSLKKLLSIHDGLSVEGNFGMGFRPLRKLTRLDSLDPGTNHQYGNVICFAGDGLGNQVCMELLEESDVVLDWDHEDQSLKRLGAFWDVATKTVRSFMYLG
jgi:hypothetical protein